MKKKKGATKKAKRASCKFHSGEWVFGPHSTDDPQESDHKK